MTHPLQATALLPFVPAQDYPHSLQFYQDLGFTLLHQSEQISGFQLGDCQFLLQNFYLKAYAQNLVLQLLVEDLAPWWEHTQKLKDKYAIRVTPPETQPWGQEIMNLWDPSGVLWYVTSRTRNGTAE